MSLVTFSKTDILKNMLLKPGWYTVLVKDYEKQQAGTDGSDLHVYSLVVQGGEFDGVPLRQQISEKAMGFGIDFVQACGIEIVAGQQIDLSEMVGKEIDCFVQRGEYKGKPQNQAVDFRTLSA
jgi:hypothetical protein